MSKLKISKNLFHTHTFTGWAGTTPYLYYKTGSGVVDGCGRMHIDLYCKCDECDEEVLIAKIHCDENSKLYKTKSLNIYNA